MSTGLLKPDDLRSLTGAARDGAQEAWLKGEGIPYRRNRKAELVVAWTHVYRWLEKKPLVSYAEPDFSSLGG